MEAETITQVRESYHEQLLEVTEHCHADGLVFAEQMAVMCRAFRYVRAVMKQDHAERDGIEPPERSIVATPAGRILENVMGYRTEELATGQTLKAKRHEDAQHADTPAAEEKIQDMGSHQIMSGTLPEPPKGVRRKKGPSDLDLIHLPRTKYIRINKGEVKLTSIKQRLSKLKRSQRDQGKELELICWEQTDGTIIVRHA